ncbi:MAG: hypothetical protein HC872_03035, partial [Gammaproteobacteria bacterium]|nr:hypothetical protein [Gammaproteobacteria bacterium]
PQQRAQLRAERADHERANRPDLARVLDLDARTEERLFNLLADHLLALQLQDEVSFRALFVLEPGSNGLVQRAQQYTQRMREIGRILGAQKLDAYAGYMQTLPLRHQLRNIDSMLPAHAKLTTAQGEALLALFQELDQRAGAPVATQYYEATSAVEESQRLEAALLRQERIHLEMVARMKPLLTPQQAPVFAEQERVVGNQLREAREGERRGRKADANESLPSTEPPPLLTDKVRLRIEIDVNGKQRVATLANPGRDATLSFEAPRRVTGAS